MPKHPRITSHGLPDKTPEGDDPDNDPQSRNGATPAELPSGFHGLENLGKPCAQDNGIEESEPSPTKGSVLDIGQQTKGSAKGSVLDIDY
jgi:hypothetical protein